MAWEPLLIARLIWHLGPSRRNHGWRRYLGPIEKLAAGTKGELDAWQAQALAEHLAWARAAVPFFEERARSDALADFPILTRADLQDDLENLRDHTRSRDELKLDASGGSTGKPVQFFQDDAYWHQEFATEVFLSHWWGLQPWSSTAFLWGVDDPSSVHWKAKLEMRLLGVAVLNVFDLTDATMGAFLEHIRRLRPACLHGYVSALDTFGAYAARHGGLGFEPTVVRSAAEALDETRRGRIEQAFGAAVVDAYGSRESASLAAQCLHGSYHVLSHGKVIELVDENGDAVPPGTPGRVLVTDLTNRAFGLVRYENGDVASWSEQTECPCGCPYPILERVHGRTSDFIRTPDGGQVHGEWFSHLFYGHAEVVRFQVRQTQLDRVEILTEGPAGAEDLEPILSKVRERLGSGVDVTWRSVDEIPLTPSGKYRFTVSDVPFVSEPA